jgi:hypothetical protein
MEVTEQSSVIAAVVWTVAELDHWKKNAPGECDAATSHSAESPVDPDFGRANGELEDWQKNALDRCDAVKRSADAPIGPDLGRCVGDLEDWQKDALDEYDAALRHQAAAQRRAVLARGRLRVHRARSSLGGRRRPGCRRTAASRSAGGGDSDESGPGEAGTQRLATPRRPSLQGERP